MHTRKPVIVDRWSILALAATSLFSAAPALVAASLNGQVLGGGAPIANSTGTLWAASAGEPKQLAQARSGAEGRFTVNEPTTVASVFTAARFIDGEAISGHALGLRIAAGNAPNLVDPVTGG